MLHRLYGTAAAALFALALLGPTLAQAQDVTLRFSRWLPPTYPLQTDVFEPWAQKVSEVTDGRVAVEFVGGLGAPQAHFDLIRNGVADISFSVHTYNADRFPLIMGLELPFSAPDSRTASIAMWRTYEKFFQDANEYRGVKLIGVYATGPAHIFTNDAKIEAIEDIEGLKIRVAGGIAKDVAEELNAVPVFAPATEAYEMITRGVVDGIFFPIESAHNFNLGPALGQALIVPDGLYLSSHYMFANENKWNEISAEDQAAIEEISGEWFAEFAAESWDEQDEIGRKAMEEGGTEFTVAEGELLENLKERLAVFEARWVETANEAGVDGEAALAYYREQIESLR